MKRRKRLGVALLAVVACWFLAAPLLPRFLVVEFPVDRPDAVVILSGSEDHLKRADAGAQLYFASGPRQILLTNDDLQGGWDNELKRNPYFFERTFDRLAELGVPREKITILPAKVDNTWNESQAILDFARARKLRSIVIVTSDYHTRRAFWSIDKANRNSDLLVIVGVMPVDLNNGAPGIFWWLSPHRLRTIGLEYLKLGYYRIVYR